MTISKAQKNLIRALYTRHGRKKHALTVCEGVRACRELFQSAPQLVEFICVLPELSGEWRGALEVPCYELTREEFEAVTATVTAPGVLAVMRLPEMPATDQPLKDDFVLALDRIGDPGNFGTMVRTARAAGLHEVWYTSGSVEPYSEKVIRASLGAVFSMRLRAFASLGELTAQAAKIGFGRVFLTKPSGGESCFRQEGLFDASVVVIGNEAHGIDPAEPGCAVTIPMPGEFESLNAAQAATIVIFEYVRRHMEEC